MRTIIHDHDRGFVISHVESSNKGSLTYATNGFEELPWLLFMEDANEDQIGKAEEGEKVTSRKLSKQEKRQLKQEKKANAALKRKLEREANVSGEDKKTCIRDINPFATLKDIKTVYANIIKATTKQNSDRKILQFGSVSLYASDLEHLLPDEWLNDNNISLVYDAFKDGFLKLQGKKLTNQISFLYPSVVQLLLYFPSEGGVELILPKNELHDVKFLFAPMNVIEDYQDIDLEIANNGDHWILTVLDLLSNRLYVYDSMIDELINYEKLLDMFIIKLKAGNSFINQNAKIEPVHMKCDQQSNFNDCGVYLLMISALLLSRLIEEGPIEFDISNVKFKPLEGRLFLLKLCEHLLDNN